MIPNYYDANDGGGGGLILSSTVAIMYTHFHLSNEGCLL